ncbi:TetR/AcrR family transcriptional regulator [Antarcticimicrobium luteum]|uniref:TetR/AcrR family transcriptional regulator n=1 Tax=Antarcticimicrobium luteum TaxID=2547397 RepID=A0A4R5VAM1_9RHOB|nr:TetR/AcrR family transcriptional regulator [Antarcticimicrobium luteum]TDK48675.1 TetR/AcrR family transcriptional regulator [Antarcticimicrobium luteum]
MAAEAKQSKRYSKRRESILVEALRVFSERGLESTGIKEIATSLGLTHPALYHYFASKEQLVYEAVSKAIQDEIAAMERAIESLPAHPGLQLYTLAKAQVFHELDGRIYVPFVNAFLYGPLRNAAKLSDEQRDDILRLQRRIVGLYRDVIAAGQKTGEFAAGSPTMSAFGVLGILSYAVFWFRPDGQMDAESVASAMAAQAVRSVSKLVEVGEEVPPGPV